MDFYNNIESIIREKYDIEDDIVGMTLRIGMLKPDWEGARDGVRDGYAGEGVEFDEGEYIKRYIAYIDEMNKNSVKDFELSKDVLWDKFEDEWEFEETNDIVEWERNRKFFCYYTDKDFDDIEFDQIEKYIEGEYESETGWCAEMTHLSREEFNEILSDKSKTISVDYIGIVEDEDDCFYSSIDTFTREGDK